MITAREIIALLDLAPHPEGGWYRETFRDEPGPDGRAKSTMIFFLLEAGQESAWHRVDSVEVWHFYDGAPLTLKLAPEGRGAIERTLGKDLASGERPQLVVPRDVWQSARSQGDWTLVGCTVAPGFDFSGFEMAVPGWEP
ncbi:MAG: cupin domain-containing protein [Caulobacter sp.]|nr:cupin domain-containing protein [Caulobacter sp.]